MRYLVLSLAVVSPLAMAGPECTTADRAQWQDETKFQENLNTEKVDSLIETLRSTHTRNNYNDQ